MKIIIIDTLNMVQTSMAAGQRIVVYYKFCTQN